MALTLHVGTFRGISAFSLMVKQLHSPLIPWSTGHLSPPPARTGANAVTVAAEKCKYLESLVGACRLGGPGWWEAGRASLALWCPDCSPHHTNTEHKAGLL